MPSPMPDDRPYCYACSDATRDGVVKRVRLCRLHRAAPLMLEALQRVFGRMEDNEAAGFSVDDYEAVEAAIRAATEPQP